MKFFSVRLFLHHDDRDQSAARQIRPASVHTASSCCCCCWWWWWSPRNYCI